MAHWPLHLPRNQFESINTVEKSYDYIITLIRRGKNPLSLFGEFNGPNLLNLKFPSLKDALCQVQSSGEEGFIFDLSYFIIISSLKKKGMTLHLNKLEFPATKDVLLKLVQWFWKRRFKFSQSISYFPPKKRA